jgi:hypothetical protein
MLYLLGAPVDEDLLRCMVSSKEEDFAKYVELLLSKRKVYLLLEYSFFVYLLFRM